MEYEGYRMPIDFKKFDNQFGDQHFYIFFDVIR